MRTCPQCGELTETLHEGTCEDCRDSNAAAQSQFEHECRMWNDLTPEQQAALIAEASK